MSYRIIYADPPWSYDDAGNPRGGTGRHYFTLPTKTIARMPVKRLASRDAALFMWTTCPLIDDGLAVLRAWGFRYITVAFSWVKLTKDGNPAMGAGRYTRSNTELCLLGLRGRISVQDRGVPQIVMDRRQKHSAKPPQVRDAIVRLLGDLPRVELFAREQVEGWDCFGDEVESTPGVAEVLR